MDDLNFDVDLTTPLDLGDFTQPALTSTLQHVSSPQIVSSQPIISSNNVHLLNQQTQQQQHQQQHQQQLLRQQVNFAIER
jgi:hypothetical protein